MIRPRVISEDDLKVLLANRGRVGGGVVGTRKARTNGARTPEKSGLIAGSNPAPSPIKRLFDSKWEETFCAELVLRKHAGLIKAYYYHPFSLWLPGKVRYTPDFMIQWPDGMERKLQIVEIKSGWTRNGREDRDGITRLKIAAALFPCFAWVKVSRHKGGWHEEEVG